MGSTLARCYGACRSVLKHVHGVQEERERGAKVAERALAMKASRQAAIERQVCIWWPQGSCHPCVSWARN